MKKKRRQGRPVTTIHLSLEEKEKLELLVTSTNRSRVGVRAEIILLAAAGYGNLEIAVKSGLSEQAVCKWRQRYLSNAIAGLQDAPRPGGKAKELSASEEER